jgi:glycosyltransferase involved in cell wall biosynthesis
LVRLVRKVRRARPDIVHWQYTELPFADVVTMLAIRLLGVRQVYTAHELLPWKVRAHHRWLFSRLYRIVDAIVVHNDDQEADLVRTFGVDPAKVYIAPLGDYALFATPALPQAEARRKLDVPLEAPIALFFGSIRRTKGLEVLLSAWPSLLEALPAALLLVVGKPFDGIDGTAAAAIIDEHGIRESVRTVFAHVDPDQANIYYRAADVVVLPYHEIGTSGVLRYAYNSARSVVGTSVGEQATRIVDGETGYQVPPGDPQALADALIRALRDRPTLEVMGKAAAWYAATNFDWLPSARLLLATYEKVRR